MFPLNISVRFVNTSEVSSTSDALHPEASKQTTKKIEKGVSIPFIVASEMSLLILHRKFYCTLYTKTTVFPRLERACSINFILVLGGSLFEGALRSRAHSDLGNTVIA